MPSKPHNRQDPTPPPPPLDSGAIVRDAVLDPVLDAVLDAARDGELDGVRGRAGAVSRLRELITRSRARTQASLVSPDGSVSSGDPLKESDELSGKRTLTTT